MHHIDLYRKTLEYILQNKWLDVELDSAWNSLSFQFYAGDLYDIIPKANTIAPRTKLGGNCTSNGLIGEFKAKDYEQYSLKLNYVCTLTTATQVKVAEFELDVAYVIKLVLLYDTLSVKIVSAVT